jgi:hypothetical protein
MLFIWYEMELLKLKYNQILFVNISFAYQRQGISRQLGAHPNTHSSVLLTLSSVKVAKFVIKNFPSPKSISNRDSK